MATDNQSIAIPNPGNPTQSLQLINISHPSIIKLTSTNYLAWKLQIEAILIGYDLYKYIDNNHPCPPRTITTNSVEASNPDFLPWIRQDKLLFGALIGSISHSLIPLIQQSATSREAWQTLANTYARPTRGHIKQLKDQIKKSMKGSQSISDYMQYVKCRTDQLAALGKPMDHEDIIETILEGLGDDYSHIADIVAGRDNPISFDELHEKLINRELTLQHSQSAAFPHLATANAATTRFSNSHRPMSKQTHLPHLASRQQPSQPLHATNRQQRPYLGKCQGCRQQGHTVA